MRGECCCAPYTSVSPNAPEGMGRTIVILIAFAGSKCTTPITSDSGMRYSSENIFSLKMALFFTFSYISTSLKITSKVSSYGPEFLLRITEATSISLCFILVPFFLVYLTMAKFHENSREERHRVVHFHQMIDVEFEYFAHLRVRWRKRERQVTCCSHSPLVAVMEKSTPGKSTNGIRLLLGVGYRFNDDQQLVAPGRCFRDYRSFSF